MVDHPYTQTIVRPGVFTREFLSEDSEHMVWHRDLHHRTLRVLVSTGWKFQSDNELPRPLHPGDIIHIESCAYHRLIAGSGQLVVEITEHAACGIAQ